MRPLIDSARLLLDRFGIIVSRYPVYSAPEFHLRRALVQLDIEVVLDVGAYTGEFARELRRLGYGGDILSFEPTASSFAELHSSAQADPKWRVEQLALGALPGSLDLYVNKGKGRFNSALPTTDIGRSEWGLTDPSVERVAMTTIDEATASPSTDLRLSKRASFLKIDTQGFDMEVLAGAHNTLPHVRLLQLELPLIAGYDGAPEFAIALAEIRELGFILSNISPVARFGLAVAEVDCLFVRSASSGSTKS